MPRGHVLVVEDDVDAAEAMVEVLEHAGFTASHARNGREALRRLRASAERPDAIVLDLRMPTMDGWSFRAEQRRDPLLAGIPVLAVSADVSPQAEAIDAAGFLRKPVDMRSLTAELHRIITEARERAARERAEHQERLAALGRLAAGMAHEINNPLAWIASNLRMLEERVAELGRAALPALASRHPDADGYMEETSALVKEALVGAERIRDIVEQVRSFSRPRSAEAHPVDVAGAMETALKMLEVHAKHRVKVTRRFDEVPPVEADETRLSQLFLNLLLNAADAIAASPRGQGTVEAKVAKASDGRVRIDVADDGVGIPGALQPRIFEPFFTTKDPGKGTGLGLFVCHNIVRALGGELSVESEPGRGTRVTILLPAAKRAPAPERAAPRAEAAGTKQRLLVVEDEEILGRALTRLLSRRFEVALARSVDEAVSLLSEDRGFQAILCDVHMPEKGGPELLEELQRRWPELARRVLFMSGGAITERAQRFIEQMGSRVLQKPLRPEAVEAALREVPQR